MFFHFNIRKDNCTGAVVRPYLRFGFANYLVPLMIGARDMAFPRLNAFSFWMTAFGGLFLYFSFVGGYGLYGMGTAPDAGWFAYAPLTAKTFSPGQSIDYWAIALLISGFGSIGTAINIIATVFCMRCPGMTLGKMPLLAWLSLTMAVLVILAVSPLTAAQIMLVLDRFLDQTCGRPWTHTHPCHRTVADVDRVARMRHGDQRHRPVHGVDADPADGPNRRRIRALDSWSYSRAGPFSLDNSPWRPASKVLITSTARKRFSTPKPSGC